MNNQFDGDDLFRYLTRGTIDGINREQARGFGTGSDYDYTLGKDNKGEAYVKTPADVMAEKFGRDQGIDSGVHFSDVGKFPWHPTFSDQSAYSKGLGSIKGGRWADGYNTDGMRNNSYTPSQQMVQNGLVNDEHLRQEYFPRVEQGNDIKNPAPYQTLTNLSLADKKKVTGY